MAKGIELNFSPRLSEGESLLYFLAFNYPTQTLVLSYELL